MTSLKPKYVSWVHNTSVVLFLNKRLNMADGAETIAFIYLFLSLINN